MVAVLLLLLELLVFLVIGFLFFYIPGLFILSFTKQKLTYPTNVFLPIVTGIIAFTLSVYVLSWLHLTILLYPIALLVLFLSFKRRILHAISLPKEHRIPSLLTLILAIIFSLEMIPNGNFGNTIYHFGDDLAHLAYIKELMHAFPPQHPGFAGVPLAGYHFFYDFLIASTAKLSYVSPFSLYFHFMPFLVALGWAFGAYALLYVWIKKISAALWGVFLVLFGSSFGYILFFLGHPGMTLGSYLGFEQPQTALLNAPYSFSVVIILAVLLLIHNYLQSKDRVTLFLIAIFVGIAPMFKVYGGIILIGGFGGLVLYELYKKNFSVILAGLVSAGVFAGTFGVFSGSGAGLFYFPFWPVERMFDHIFPEYGWKEKLNSYGKYQVIGGLATTYVYSIAYFLIANLGTRFIGILLLPLLLLRSRKLPSVFACLILLMLSVSVIVPMFFAQTIKVFDMIQMLWYYPFFASLFAAIGLSNFFSLQFSKLTKIVIGLLIVLATLPTAYANLQTHVIPLLTVKRTSLSNDYYQAMAWLSQNGSYTDTVLELPVGKEYIHKENAYAWFNSSSAHIPAFGNHRTFLQNQYIVFPNMPVDQRLDLLVLLNSVEFGKNRNDQEVAKVLIELKNNNISYIYIAKPLTMFADTSVRLVFQNPVAVIYKIN